MSIEQFFKKISVQRLDNSGAPSLCPPAGSCTTVDSTSAYTESVKKSIDANLINIVGNPIVKPTCPFVVTATLNDVRQRGGESLVTEEEVAALTLRPEVFAWVPENIFPGVRVKCPSCESAVSSGRWSRNRTLHGLAKQAVYITKEYICYKCAAVPTSKRSATKSEDTRKPKPRKQKQFQADAPEALAVLPARVSSMWHFANSGRILCEAGVVDFVRALATRTSWSGIADAINELKTTAWERDVVSMYSALCNHLGLNGVSDRVQFPTEHVLSADWVRNAYVADAQKRHTAVRRELSDEAGDDVLVLDWTVDAAARCSSEFLFNAMDGRRRILMSSLTAACSPHEVEPLLAALNRRGVRPKVIYVDSECCGAWPTIVGNIWPGAAVKLDGMHDIRRLTRTSSTQHPWHGRFCAALSDAVYTYDAETMARLAAARRRAGLRGGVPSHAKSKYVPRIVVDAARIASEVGRVLGAFEGAHTEAGPLLTPAAMEAWRDLRPHVLSGCLCDPPDMKMNVFGEGVTIGGERFRTVRTLRGASALEGFHAHQKQWLGCLARHAADAGAALLADGAVRWNRKRRREALRA